jgi:hypothetical protein
MNNLASRGDQVRRLILSKEFPEDLKVHVQYGLHVQARADREPMPT